MRCLWVIEFRTISFPTWDTSGTYQPQDSREEGRRLLKQAKASAHPTIEYRLVKYVREGA